MRSRGVRLTVAALAWLTIPAAAYVLIQSEKQIGDERVAVRDFDLHAREATELVADLRASEQAYVAEGQGAAFWMPKVATTTEAIRQAITSLGTSAHSVAAQSALEDATGVINEFASIDQRT